MSAPLSPKQFETFDFGGAPVRDLTATRLTKSNRAQERAATYRDARDQYEGEMEKHAIGYSTEEKEYRQKNPPPTWKGFLKEGFAAS